MSLKTVLLKIDQPAQYIEDELLNFLKREELLCSYSWLYEVREPGPNRIDKKQRIDTVYFGIDKGSFLNSLNILWLELIFSYYG